MTNHHALYWIELDFVLRHAAPCCAMLSHSKSHRSRLTTGFGHVPPESLHSSPRWFDAGEAWSSNRLPIWIFSGGCCCQGDWSKHTDHFKDQKTYRKRQQGGISKKSWLLLFHNNYTSDTVWMWKKCKTIRTEHHRTTVQKYRSGHELYEKYCRWHLQGRIMGVFSIL